MADRMGRDVWSAGFYCIAREVRYSLPGLRAVSCLILLLDLISAGLLCVLNCIREAETRIQFYLAYIPE